MGDQPDPLSHLLRQLPYIYKNRYNEPARRCLLEALFRSLTGFDDTRTKLFFPLGFPDKSLSLKTAQGAVEGSEYTEAARGKACGHILRSGEPSYRCKTCATDDTCVLCSRCYEASDHTGHIVYFSPSSGGSGCCDCGDGEAWKIPVKCAIHTTDNSGPERSAKEEVPPEIVVSIKFTIATVLDYICDVISCSPEQLRIPKTEEIVFEDEKNSRLIAPHYGPPETFDLSSEFALLIWNDEKHTIRDVQSCVERACKESSAFGLDKANETNDVGRSLLFHSNNLQRLLDAAAIIERIRLTVTIRSSRDIFREEMCGTIIEWLLDITGCKVGEDPDIIRQTICEELLGCWSVGSVASNAGIGKQGLYDHQMEERIWREDANGSRRLFAIARVLDAVDDADGGTIDYIEDDEDEEDEDEDEDDEDGEEDEEEYERLLAENANSYMDIDSQNGAEDDIDGDTNMENSNIPDSEEGEGSAQAQERQASRRYMYEDPMAPHLPIPLTPNLTHRAVGHPSKYWTENHHSHIHAAALPPHEDLSHRLRLDWLLLFDLRLWKKTRTDLRDLYISTVVTIPEFKRILGLRYAGLYTALAQLYLVGDREPEQSIIKFSVQILTTPSITQEIIQRGNFLSRLIAIIYTFLTNRQVGYPEDVTARASLDYDEQSLHNRRLWHFFDDLRFVFDNDYAKKVVRDDPQYLHQFISLVKLPQGMCAYTRAVGDHVEYEADSWVSASLLTRQVNYLCRQFAACFKRKPGDPDDYLERAIRRTAKSLLPICLGTEAKRVEQSEIKEVTKFKAVPPYPFDLEFGRLPEHPMYVVDFTVEKGSLSFHHPLHYLLSWLIEYGKSMSKERLRNALYFSHVDLKQIIVNIADPTRLPTKAGIIGLFSKSDTEGYLLSLFDFPLRVCVWLSQIKAGMWVRNGLSLRHQMTAYRGNNQRYLAHHRDIVLLQTALVVCDPDRILASMIDRFGVDNWIRGLYVVMPDFEESQFLDLVEDFVQLMVILLSDRVSLLPIEDSPSPQILSFKRDVIHVLCFKPLSFSDLIQRLADRFEDLEEYQEALDELTIYHPPEGTSDTGKFELKEKYVEDVDPYTGHYNKNARDEAESVYRRYMAKKTGKPISEIIYEPKLLPIRSGAFSDLAAFTRTETFIQIVFHLLLYGLQAKVATPKIQPSRVETFLQVLLHLILIAIQEDRTQESDANKGLVPSFVKLAINTPKVPGRATIVSLLAQLSTKEEYSHVAPKIKLVLRRLWQKYPDSFDSASTSMYALSQIDRTDSPANASLQQELALKKKMEAKARQDKIMAQMAQQQQAFLAAQTEIDWGMDDVEETEAPKEASIDQNSWKYPSGTCVLCREDTNDDRLYGTFAMLIDSHILRQTPLNDPDYVKEAASVPQSLDRSAEHIRPFGVAGKNCRGVHRMTADGREIVVERQEISKGFPPNSHIDGPVSTGCGHIMHFYCFDQYCSSIEIRHRTQVARLQPDRLHAKEFVCPLCKALGNAFYPIIWKRKVETPAAGLWEQQCLENWLRYEIGLVIDRSFTLNQFEKDPQCDVFVPRDYSFIRETALKYASKSFITSLADDLNAANEVMSYTPQASQSSSESPLPMFPVDEPPNSYIQNVCNPSLNINTLVVAYRRLWESMTTNVTSLGPYSGDGLADEASHRVITLSKALGFSISATEIAQRGVETESGLTLIDQIPQHSLDHLKVLAETAYTYLALGLATNPVSGEVVSQYMCNLNRQILQLFVGHPSLFGGKPIEGRNVPPGIFEDDMFLFLAECSIYLIPCLQLDPHHIVHLCYFAEVVKVIQTILMNVTKKATKLEYLQNPQAPSPGPAELSGFRLLISLVGSCDHQKWSPNEVAGLYNFARSYALTFLRKAFILMNVRFGFKFNDKSGIDPAKPEMERLCSLMKLPSLGGLGNSLREYTIKSMVDGWLQHSNAAEAYRFGSSRPFMLYSELKISHPGIPELIGLPYKYNVLLDEAVKHRCPTTGKEMTDPAICLFCGEYMCSQAFCCSQGGSLGGCNKHLGKCGGNVGLFISIRKCVVIYLHDHDGSFTPAPYLDKHGEADTGLRRGRELFLNQKRYDTLQRKIWLHHEIPTTIARRLEAEINNGGWETL